MKKLLVVLIVSTCLFMTACAQKTADDQQDNTVVIRVVSLCEGLVLADESKEVTKNENYDVTELAKEVLEFGGMVFSKEYSYGDLQGIASTDYTIIVIYTNVLYGSECPVVGNWTAKISDEQKIVFNFLPNGTGQFGAWGGALLSTDYRLNEENSTLYIGYYNSLENTENYFVDIYTFLLNDDGSITLILNDKTYYLVRDDNKNDYAK